MVIFDLLRNVNENISEMKNGKPVKIQTGIIYITNLITIQSFINFEYGYRKVVLIPILKVLSYEEYNINKLLYYKLIYTILYSNYYILIINSPKVQTSQTSPKVHLFDHHVP